MKIVVFAFLFLFILFSCGEKDNDDNLETMEMFNRDCWKEIEVDEISFNEFSEVVGKKTSTWEWKDESFFKTFSTDIKNRYSSVTDIYISEDNDIYLSGLICDGSEPHVCSFLTILNESGERIDYYLKNHTESSFSSKVIMKENEIYVLLNHAGEVGEGYSECVENDVLLISVGNGLGGSETVIRPKFDNCHKCWDMASFEGYLALLCLTSGEKYSETTDVVLIGSDQAYKMNERLNENDFPFHIVKNKNSLSLYSKVDDKGYNEYVVSFKNEELNIKKTNFQRPKQPMSIRRIAHDNNVRVFCGQDLMGINSKPSRFDNIFSNTSFGTVSKFDENKEQIGSFRVLTKEPPDVERIEGSWVSSIVFAFEEGGVVYYVGYSTFDTENKGRVWNTKYQTDTPIPFDMLYSAYVFAEKNKKIYVRQLISDIIPVYPIMMKKKGNDLYIIGVHLDGNYRQGVFIHKVDENFLFDKSASAHYSIFAVCGNNQVEPGEDCDGSVPCNMISDSYSGGTAQCVQCSIWDTKDCIK